ncbi:UNVERIFIED_CONTAM: hypothetical protein Slati_3489600 [Sesamum latifolium]|uniref:Aminotransferase-like plant mobile domain-containing protein n=1 Tax=Sesamum latifolium TaxID=2727402 RepID=A0AAW2UHV3_9LAMI
MVRPKSTHNPLGDITTHKRWSTAEEALFEKLCIEGNLKEEVYLAAYLACWLCTFILPGKDVNSIRPSTFKMASMMANGRRVSLAIPVLASIYEGLNIIPSSSRPARTSPSFPVHFVYAWLASYFKTHYPIWQGLRGSQMTRFSGEGGAKYYDPQEARKQIHKAEFVSWACNMIVKNRPFKFIDNGDVEELDHDYFIVIRSNYLTLRQGDKFIIEPYSPHRFGRQFGYFQDVSGTLKYDTRAASLEEGLCYWRLCVLSKSSSKAWLPGLPTNTKKFCSEAYKAWLAKVHGTFLDDNILEDEIQSIDASENLRLVIRGLRLLLHLGWDLKERNFHSLLQCQYLKSEVLIFSEVIVTRPKRIGAIEAASFHEELAISVNDQRDPILDHLLESYNCQK